MTGSKVLITALGGDGERDELRLIDIVSLRYHVATTTTGIFPVGYSCPLPLRSLVSRTVTGDGRTSCHACIAQQASGNWLGP